MIAIISMKITIPSSTGKYGRRIDSWRTPTRRPPATAPRKLPRPPNTTITNAGMMIDIPSSGLTLWRPARMMPAKAASAAPPPNTSE